MCEGSASFAVDRDGVEGACGEREVLPVGLLTRPRSDRSRSCERVTEPSVPEQATPERPTDVLIVVPTPLIDTTFLCCPGCKALNEPVIELVPIKEDHPVTLPCNNQGQGTRMATVCSGQCARCGGCSDHRGYGGVACMQPSTVPRHEYPDQCE